eukprot:57219_1
MGNGEKGTLPIENINRTKNICNNTIDYSQSPSFPSRILGAGNVIQTDFDRDTNMGYDILMVYVCVSIIPSNLYIYNFNYRNVQFHLKYHIGMQINVHNVIIVH